MQAALPYFAFLLHALVENAVVSFFLVVRGSVSFYGYFLFYFFVLILRVTAIIV